MKKLLITLFASLSLTAFTATATEKEEPILLCEDTATAALYVDGFVEDYSSQQTIWVYQSGKLAYGEKTDMMYPEKDYTTIKGEISKEVIQLAFQNKENPANIAHITVFELSNKKLSFMLADASSSTYGYCTKL